MSVQRSVAVAAAWCVAQITWAAAAPVGTAFTYQGQLKQDGAPANGDFDFRFRLLSSGVPVNVLPYCVQQAPVVNGLFTVELDFGGAVFDGTSLELQVDVKPFNSHEIFDCVSNTLPDPFTPLSPRQALTPTPYAIHVLSAPNGHALDAPDGAPTDALVVDNDGDVGIGTIPANGENFHVKGDARFDGPDGIGVHNPNNLGALVRLSWLNNVARIRWGGTDPGGSNGFDFQKIGDISLLRILDNGNVGIGTTAPGNKLEVVAASNGDGVRLTGSNTSGTKSPGYHLYDSTTQRGTLGLAEASNAFSTDAEAGDIVLRTNTGKLLLQNGTGASAIAVSGNNVGIGKATPTAKLEIGGIPGTDGIKFPDGSVQVKAVTVLRRSVTVNMVQLGPGQDAGLSVNVPGAPADAVVFVTSADSFLFPQFIINAQMDAAGDRVQVTIYNAGTTNATPPSTYRVAVIP